MNLQILYKYFQHRYLWIRKPNSKKMYWPSRDFLGLYLCTLCVHVLSARVVVLAWCPPTVLSRPGTTRFVQASAFRAETSWVQRPLSCMEITVRYQHLVFSHSNARALFIHLALVPKAWQVEKILEMSQTCDFVIKGIITSTQLVTEKWVSKLFKISTTRKELSERNLSGLQVGNWKEPNANDREVNDSKIEGSFISFIQWGKTWTKNSLFKPDAVFVIFISMMNCFNSLLFWICNIKQANHYINKGTLEICKVGLKKNWM